MKIRCKIIRKGGSHIDIDGVVYHFAPNERDDHVAEVSEARHIQRFLSITEGYEPYEAEVAQALEEQANQLTEVEARVPTAVLPYQQWTQEELRAEYERIFGRLAPPLAKHETLVKKLTAHALEKAAATTAAPE